MSEPRIRVRYNISLLRGYIYGKKLILVHLLMGNIFRLYKST